MTDNRKKPILVKMLEERAAKRRRVGIHLHKIEGNPFTDEDIAMFEMFDREGWSSDRRREYIIEQSLIRTGK